MEDYLARSDLTDEEKEALSNYQDIGNDQHVWSCVIPDDEDHHDCYVINKSLRDAEFLATLSEEDMAVFDTVIGRLDSAIEKSSIIENTLLIKGLYNADWIRDKHIADDYVDDGYGSYSIDFERAFEYTSPQSDGARVFILYSAEKGTKGVYMGNKEEEILLQRGKKYTIRNIISFDEDEFLDGSKAIIYIVGDT